MAESPNNGRGLTLPSIAAMTSGLPPHDSRNGQSIYDTRDSGNWSMQSQSKHSSTMSNGTGVPIQSILNAEPGMNRISGGPVTPQQQMRFPPLQQPSPPVVLPALSQAFDHRGSTASMDPQTSYLDSRRSSIDSHMNNNMGHLGLGHGTPYESNNQSTASLVSNLQQQRGIPQSRTNGYPPSVRRTSAAQSTGPRRAPAIQPSNRAGGMPNPLSSEPTRGFAWAFPDQADPTEMDEDSDSANSSRQGSIAATSIHTIDSVAHSVRQGNEGPDSHRQSAQHHRVANLQANGPGSTGNYSRTPELRVNHKLAERKRRSEMKELFQELNKNLPNSPGPKASKYETISKAIEYLSALKSEYDNTSHQNQQMQRELKGAELARADNQQLQNEIMMMWEHLERIDPNSRHVFGAKTEQMYNLRAQASNRHAPLHPQQQAPPSWGAPLPNSAMQGVEYGGHAYDRR